MARHVEPTAQQLQQAFAMQRRPGWPATLPEAMVQPLCAALIRGQAVRLALRDERLTQPAIAAAAPTAPRPAPASPPLRPLATLDRKRAAAGDRDD